MENFTGVFSCTPIGDCDVDISQEVVNEPTVAPHHNPSRVVDEFVFMEHQSDKIFQFGDVIVALIGQPSWEDEVGKSPLTCEQNIKRLAECWQSQGVESLFTGQRALTIGKWPAQL